MAEMADTARRRIAFIANHIMPAHPSQSQRGNTIAILDCSSSMNDSFHRVHGEVPTHIPVWTPARDDSGKEYTDIIYEKASGEGIAKDYATPSKLDYKRRVEGRHITWAPTFVTQFEQNSIIHITINRPERRNAFRPQTIKELMRAFNDARDDNSIGVIIFTGKGTKAFCSGGDQSLRGNEGYVDYDSFGRLNVLDLQVQIRRLPKPVIAMVAGYAVGGGHVLHMVCDLTIAADNAMFGQTGPKVGSFDAGYGASIMSRLIGPKKAREMWYMTRFYTATEAEKMGLINTVVQLEKLEEETIKWCREILRNSPMAIRVLKSAINAVDDGHAGLQGLGGDATLLFYGTEEGNEGKNAYLQRRKPDFSKFPRLP